MEVTVSAGGSWIERIILSGAYAVRMLVAGLEADVSPRRWRSRLPLWLLTSVVLSIGWLAASVAPAAADYGPGYFSSHLLGQASIFSDPGSVLGYGVESTWAPAFAGVSGYPNSFDVNVTPPTGDTWHFDFGAPQGQVLHDGVYDDAIGSPASTRPFLSATQGGESCSGSGRFEIKDLAYDSTGAPTRLWVLYELYCSDSPAIFGELRFGEPGDDPSLHFTPSVVRWPAKNFGSTETPLPVVFTATQDTTVSDVAVAGTDPQDFRISRDACTGLQLRAGAGCTVWVDFDPVQAGARSAVLQLTGSDGAVHGVPLQGFTYGGTTRLVVNSDPGDQLLNGQGYSFSGPLDAVWATGNPQVVQFSASDATEGFEGTFAAPTGQSLTPGSSWSDVATYPFDNGGPGMEIGFHQSLGADVENNWGCETVGGQFQVKSATYDSNGQMTSFDLRFSLFCGQSTGALHGEFQWRAGDDVAPAPWMEPDGTGATSQSPGTAPPAGGDTPGLGGTGDTTGAGNTTGTGDTTGPGSVTHTPATTGPITPTTTASPTPTTIAPVTNDAAATAHTPTTPPAATPSLKSLSTTLSLDSRRVATATQRPGARVARSWVLRARRSISVLEAALTTTERRLRAFIASNPSSARRALERLSAWQATLTAEQRVLSLSRTQIAVSLPGLVSRANRQSAAGIRALATLNRP